jgi:Skp family chaperone for outer membrane proteins
MRRRMLFTVSPAIFCLPVLGLGQAPVPASQAAPPPAPVVIGPAKIAFLQLEQAIYSCDEGKREFGELQKFVEKKNADMEAAKKELDTLKNQHSVQGAKLTDEARADLEEQIEGKETHLQRFQQDTQKEIDARRLRVTNFIGRKMLPIVEKLAKEKGVNAVMYLNPSGQAWVDPSLFVTDEVIKAYNTAYPAAAAPGAAPRTKP